MVEEGELGMGMETGALRAKDRDDGAGEGEGAGESEVGVKKMSAN